MINELSYHASYSSERARIDSLSLLPRMGDAIRGRSLIPVLLSLHQQIYSGWKRLETVNAYREIMRSK